MNILKLFEDGFIQLNEYEILDNQFSEIILCTPSILIDLDDNSNALNFIEKGI